MRSPAIIALALAGCGGARATPTPAPAIANTPEPSTRRYDALHVPTAADLPSYIDDLPGSGALIATISTGYGPIHCELAAADAPLSVANFVGLARGILPWVDPSTGDLVYDTPFYDGLTFHRVIPEFMIQGGDPKGNGTGDPGWQLETEVSPALHFDRPGVLAMANAGAGTTGSQFFITEVATEWLDGMFSIVGHCDGLDVVMAVARVPRDGNDRPYEPERIQTIEITRAP